MGDLPPGLVGLLGASGGVSKCLQGGSHSCLLPEPEEEPEQDAEQQPEQPTLDYNDQIEREDYEDCE